MLTHQRLKQVLAYDPATGVFTWRIRMGTRGRVGHVAGHTISALVRGGGYVLICIDRRKYKAHRLAWFYVKGVWPAEQIDHKRGKSNRWTNLREASHAENARNVNRRSTNTSGITGVSYAKRNHRWRVQISGGMRGKQISLGYFATLAEAAAARRAAETKYHKQFAWAEQEA